MNQPSQDVARIVQTTTGRAFQLRPATPSDWAGQWPTDRVGDVLISEAPGSCDGSVFAFWLGGLTLQSAGVMSAIQTHIDDHDVVGLRVIFDLPDDAHSSLKADLAELKQRKAAVSLLAVREGMRVRVKTNQARIGGDKYPGREGIVQNENGTTGEYWNVLLTATTRAQERLELFNVGALDVLTTVDEIAMLPPLSGKQFAEQFSETGYLLFAGVSYSLQPHQVAGYKDGWAINVSYPDGSRKLFGQHHPLTRTLAVRVAAQDAMDWWLNRREAQAQVTSH